MKKIPYDLIAARNNATRKITRHDEFRRVEEMPMPQASPFDAYSLNVFNQTMEKMLKAVQRQGTFLSQPFTVFDTPILLRQKENRTYFMIQNTGLNGLYIGFDFEPTATNCINLTAGGFAEPYQVPTNDIYILSTVAGTTGILIYSIGN